MGKKSHLSGKAFDGSPGSLKQTTELIAGLKNIKLKTEDYS